MLLFGTKELCSCEIVTTILILTLKKRVLGTAQGMYPWRVTLVLVVVLIWAFPASTQHPGPKRQHQASCDNLILPNARHTIKAISFYWNTLLLVHGYGDITGDLYFTKLKLNRSLRSIQSEPLNGIPLDDQPNPTESFLVIFDQLQAKVQELKLFTFHFLDERRLTVWFKSKVEQLFVSFVYQTKANYVLSGTQLHDCEHFQILYQFTTDSSHNPIPTKSVFTLSYIATTADTDIVYFLTGEVIFDRTNNYDHNYEFYIHGNVTTHYLGFGSGLTKLYVATDWNLLTNRPDYIPFESKDTALAGKWRAFLYYDYVYILTGNSRDMVLYFKLFDTANYDEPNLLVEIPLGRMEMNDLFDCSRKPEVDENIEQINDRLTFPVGELNVTKIEQDDVPQNETNQWNEGKQQKTSESSVDRDEDLRKFHLLTVDIEQSNNKTNQTADSGLVEINTNNQANERDLFKWLFTVQCFILAIIVLSVSVLISLLFYLCSIKLRLQSSHAAAALRAVHGSRALGSSRQHNTTTTTTTEKWSTESKSDTEMPQTLLVPIPSPTSIVSISTRKELVTIQSINNNLVINHKRILFSPNESPE